MNIPSLRPPRLRTAVDEDHRSATWLELFYDLVFVVAVGQLGHRLLVNHGVGGVFGFIGLFIPLWWTWASYTFYADRYDTDDLGQRILAVAQMVSIVIMAASVSGDNADSMAGFAVAFVLARLVLLAMYGRAHRNVPESKELVGGYLRGFTLGGLFWVASIWVPDPWRFVLWAIGLAIDLYTPWSLREIQKQVPLSVSHLPERFGLFTILVLGESFVAIVAAVAHAEWEFATTFAGVVGVMIAWSLWALYFDNQEGKVVRRRSGQAKAWKPTVWIYTHLPLVVAITVTGIGLEFLIAQETEPTGRWMVTLGAAVSLVSMALLLIATDRGTDAKDARQAMVRVGSAVVLVVIGVVSAGWAPNAILVAVLLVGLAQVADDVVLEGQPITSHPAELVDEADLEEES